MASYDDSEEAEVGQDLGFLGKHKKEKKSKHLGEAEKALLEENVPVMTMKVGCMVLYQDAKIRAN